jgi:glycosyltransferase involved in cell wall biosynthesis
MQRICSALGEVGHDVTLVGRRRSTSAVAEFAEFTTHRFPCIFQSGALFYMELNLRIFFYILFHEMEVLVAVDLDTILPVTLAGKIKKLPVVFDAHEWFTEVPELIDRLQIKKIWHLIEDFSLPKTSLRFTVNQSLAEIFQAKFNLKFGVIRNVPEATPGKFESKNIKKTILYQGALNKGRGIEPSICAMRHLPDYELWIVGEGDLSRELRELTTEKNVGEQVKFLGYQSPDALKRITPQAHIGLNLLEGTSLNYYYSLANKFFDYMHAGIPSVNMEFPEYAMILAQHPCGAMIEHCDAERIADAVRAICEDEPVYQDMVKAAQMASSHYQWGVEKKKLVEMFDDI